MSQNYRILGLLHFGIPVQDEEELSLATRFYDHMGFENMSRDLAVVKWFKLDDGRELHAFVDDHAPCPVEVNMVHGCFEVDDIEAVWQLWMRLWEEGWTDPVNGRRYSMSRQAYRDPPIKDIVVGRVHAFDPWNNHIEFWQLEKPPATEKETG